MRHLLRSLLCVGLPLFFVSSHAGVAAPASDPMMGGAKPLLGGTPPEIQEALAAQLRALQPNPTAQPAPVGAAAVDGLPSIAPAAGRRADAAISAPSPARPMLDETN